jgi:hypothetical protein
MDLNRGRVRQMVDEMKAKDGCIPCHRTLDGDNAVCRGQFDLHKTPTLTLGERVGRIRFTTEDDMAIPMPTQRKQELCNQFVTLNGQPANVSGYMNDFARVVQLESGLSAEFAWQTVEHIIMNRDGKFQS